MTAKLGLALCGGGSGLGPPGATIPPPLLCTSSSISVRESVRGTILSCLAVSICLSVCCLEDTTWPLVRVSVGASEMVTDLSASWSIPLMSQLLLPSESSISAPMQLYTMLTRSVDWMRTEVMDTVRSSQIADDLMNSITHNLVLTIEKAKALIKMYSVEFNYNKIKLSFIFLQWMSSNPLNDH